MEAFIVHGVPVLDLVACNACRMFLRAIFLSDIVNGDGLCISEDAWNGNLFLTPHKHRAWPQYGKLPRSCWETWRKWLKQIFLGRGRRLKAPLGSWLAFDDNWPWYRSSEGLQFNNGTWLLHTSIIRRNRLPTFYNTGNPCPAPPTVRRATVYFKGDQIVCTGSDFIEKSNTPTYSSFQDFLTADKDINWCLYSLSITKEQDLVEAIKEGSAMAISDGSYKSCYGTAAWTIGDPDTASILSAKVVNCLACTPL